MDHPAIVRAWCQQRVGCPYIMGATGKACTPSYREARMAQYPASAEKIKKNCPRLMGRADTCQDCRWCDPETGIGKPAYDCAQLSRYAMADAGIELVSGANSQWEKTDWAVRGEIADLPADHVALVFRRDDGKMGHVGVYQGDGTVIHARGHDYGVVEQPLADVKITHFGIPVGLYSDCHYILRNGKQGDAVAYLQSLLCDVGETLTVDGKFGPKTEKAVEDFQRLYGLTVNGVVGPGTWQELEYATGHDEAEPAPEPPPQQPDTVTVSGEDWDTLCRIINKYGNVG